MKSKICLIRHGITEGNKRKLFYGHADIDLAEEGVAELTALAAEGFYPEAPNADFYTTGLKRTEQTLQIIYGNKERKQIELLKEINFGDFEMKTYAELKDIEEYQPWLRNPKGDLAPPNGESINMFYERILEGFEELKGYHAAKLASAEYASGEILTVMVCHGGTISAIMESLYPGEKDNFYQWIPDPGHGYIVLMEDGEVTGTQKF